MKTRKLKTSDKLRIGFMIAVFFMMLLSSSCGKDEVAIEQPKQPKQPQQTENPNDSINNGNNGNNGNSNSGNQGDNGQNNGNNGGSNGGDTNSGQNGNNANKPPLKIDWNLVVNKQDLDNFFEDIVAVDFTDTTKPPYFYAKSYFENKTINYSDELKVAKVRSFNSERGVYVDFTLHSKLTAIKPIMYIVDGMHSDESRENVYRLLSYINHKDFTPDRDIPILNAKIDSVLISNTHKELKRRKVADGVLLELKRKGKGIVLVK